MLQALLIVFVIIQVVLVVYLLVPTLLLISYGLLRLFKIKTPYQRKKNITDKNFEFGIIITAHQEKEFIAPLVDSLLKQTYQNFYLYIVADDCDTSDLLYSQPNVNVLKPQPALHSKIKSIQHAISNFTKKHDAIIIFDSDNLVHPLFMDTMNKHFQKGYRVVQANFKPKNLDTDYARMDAIGDMFNFFVERESRMYLGLSSAIWGSGVAVDYDLYTRVSYNNFLGGFDKKLQAYLVKSVKQIAYSPDAILYDEKISSGKSLENQRTRWISSYFKYFKDNFDIFFTGLKRGNFNLMYFGFITLRPPLFLVLLLSVLCTGASFFINITFFYGWLIVWGLFFITFVSIVLVKGKDPRFLFTILKLPLFVGRQVLALTKIKKAKKSFIKTTHTQLLYIDDLLNDKKRM